MQMQNFDILLNLIELVAQQIILHINYLAFKYCVMLLF